MTTHPSNNDQQPTWLPEDDDPATDTGCDFDFENQFDDPWGDHQTGDPQADDADCEQEEFTAPQIELLLSAVSNDQTNSVQSNSVQSDENPTQPANADAPSDNIQPVEMPGGEFPAAQTATTDDVAKEALASDRELLEAYLDDSLRCLASMEQAALALENSPCDRDCVQQFCRELHTLKGASATVGLSNLASELHELETRLESVFSDPNAEADIDALFNAVDKVRSEIESLRTVDSADSPQESAAMQEAPTASNSNPLPSESNSSNSTRPNPGPIQFSDFSSNDDSSVRIRAAKLDRLMDMLAELVVLRNRRENHSNEFNLFNEELSRCATRLSFDLDSNFTSPTRGESSSFAEVAKDIAAVSQGMRELQSPVNQDNAAISHFIRDFRQELMQLRRVPVSGLFQKLQRAARDAAKSEGKQVRFELIGENVGLEQEIQEKLFESLLHIVRNSVSHGIQSPEERTRIGKNPVGNITLAAQSSAQLLTLEVRDDGNGVDYEAVRKRAIEKSLIAPNQIPSEKELSNLIFHPGFSTREHANAVSGRGVGMEIVARTIEQLHGRIDVESQPGHGTTIRIGIPLRTGIEHVMVFRCAGQLFALPMQSVTAAKSSNATLDVARISLSSATSPTRSSDEKTKNKDVLILRQSYQQSQKQLALEVDELVGPEEVVVRGLPNLLKQHPLFCGVTLSGSGESVLLLESEKVAEFCEQSRSTESNQNENSTLEKPDNRTRVLVVDDSLTARKSLVEILRRQGMNPFEAGDGVQAIERLHRETFDLVFTDLDMPLLGGMELLSDIQSGNYCEAPVVVASSRDEETFRTKAMDLGAIDYVSKPVSEKAVAQVLMRTFPHGAKSKIDTAN